MREHVPPVFPCRKKRKPAQPSVEDRDLNGEPALVRHVHQTRKPVERAVAQEMTVWLEYGPKALNAYVVKLQAGNRSQVV
jgi:hypothetical protein